MVIDPVCSLVFEAETDEEDVMRRRPRAPDEPLFSWPTIAWSVLQGGLAFGLVALIFVVALHRGMPQGRGARARLFLAGALDYQPHTGEPLVQHVSDHGV
jgi:magnesium-transporting ATPase (P-type)